MSDYAILDFTKIGRCSHNIDDDKGATRTYMHIIKGKCRLQVKGLSFIRIKEKCLFVRRSGQ